MKVKTENLSHLKIFDLQCDSSIFSVLQVLSFDVFTSSENLFFSTET